jgi:hypothetical protein
MPNPASHPAFNPAFPRDNRPIPFAKPAAAGELLQWPVDQVYQSLCDAYGKVDLLVLETGADADAFLTSQAVLAPFVVPGTSCGYLGFAEYPDPQPMGGVLSILDGEAQLWPDIDQALLSALLSHPIVFLDDIAHALDAAPVRIGKLLSWCTSNLALTVLLAPDARCLTKLDLGPLRVAVDRLQALNGAQVKHSSSLTAALLNRVAK